jgi:HEAT repeat protein
LLAEALDDDLPEAAAAAATALGDIGTREALAPLLHALSREELVAHAAADALGRLAVTHYDEVRVLVSSRGLHGPDAPHLCRVLGACGRAQDTQVLKQALGADAAATRRAAADALGQLPPASDVDEALRFALADESHEVRAAAARALGAHGALAAGEALMRTALEDEPMVRAAASRALGLLAARHPQARPLLRAVVDSSESVASVPALEALARLEDPEDDARFVTALAGGDSEKVKAAARALGRRQTQVALAALEAALGDRRWDVRCAAVQALAEQGASELLAARLEEEQDPLVLQAIEVALQRDPRMRGR